MIPGTRIQEEARRRPSEIFRKAAAPARLLERLASKTRAHRCLPGPDLSSPGRFAPGAGPRVRPRRKPLPRCQTGAQARPHRAGRVSSRLEAYFNDHFGFRKRLIYWLAIAKVQGLGVTSTPDVALGSNGWLYYASASAVLSFRATRPFTPAKLERYRLILEARRDWLAERGIPYLSSSCPTKTPSIRNSCPLPTTRSIPGRASIN